MKGESVEVHASCIMKNLIFYHKVWIFFLSRENLCHVCFLSKMILLIRWGIGEGRGSRTVARRQVRGCCRSSGGQCLQGVHLEWRECRASCGKTSESTHFDDVTAHVYNEQ